MVPNFPIFLGIVALVKSQGAVVPIMPEMTFKKADGSLFPVPPPLAIPDLSKEPNLVNFIRSAVEVCFVGAWRMYFLVDFEYTNDSEPGYGFSRHGVEEPTCVDITGYGPSFANMKSLRPLGPLTGNGLSQKSITLYEKSHGTGKGRTYYETTGPTIDLPFPIGSYFMTAESWNDAVENEAPAVTSPVFKVHWERTGPFWPGREVCIVLNGLNDPTARLAKMYYRPILDPIAGEPVYPLKFGSLTSIPYANMQADCAEDGTTLPRIRVPPIVPHAMVRSGVIYF